MDPIKAIIAADSGFGKSGAIWSLAAAGFKIRWYDFDRGTRICRSALKMAGVDASKIDIEVETFTDKLKGASATGFSKPDDKEKLAWSRYLDALNKWPKDPTQGPLTWGTDVVMVVDSLTFAGKAAMQWAQRANNRSGKKPEWTDYGDAQAQIDANMQMLYSDYVNCHIVYLTHVKVETDDEGNFTGAFPSTVGKALNNVIPRYVNNILTIKMQGLGATTKRILSTIPTSNRIATKTEELAVAKEYVLAEGTTPKPGLAEFFADLGWAGPNQ